MIVLIVFPLDSIITIFLNSEVNINLLYCIFGMIPFKNKAKIGENLSGGGRTDRSLLALPLFILLHLNTVL
jgi:hypothetical protein